MRVKPLTEDQQKHFIDLYLQGYSASLIFERLGFPYDVNDSFAYNQRMRYYRVKLNLPSRGVGFIPKHTRHKTVKSDVKRKRRIETLVYSICYWNAKIDQWRKELDQLGKQAPVTPRL
jgi:hypothetical protein